MVLILLVGIENTSLEVITEESLVEILDGLLFSGSELENVLLLILRVIGGLSRSNIVNFLFLIFSGSVIDIFLSLSENLATREEGVPNFENTLELVVIDLGEVVNKEGESLLPNIALPFLGILIIIVRFGLHVSEE